MTSSAGSEPDLQLYSLWTLMKQMLRSISVVLMSVWVLIWAKFIREGPDWKFFAVRLSSSPPSLSRIRTSFADSPQWSASTASTPRAACGPGRSARSEAGGTLGNRTPSGILERPGPAPWSRWPSPTCWASPRTGSSTRRSPRRRYRVWDEVQSPRPGTRRTALQNKTLHNKTLTETSKL